MTIAPLSVTYGTPFDRHGIAPHCFELSTGAAAVVDAIGTGSEAGGGEQPASEHTSIAINPGNTARIIPQNAAKFPSPKNRLRPLSIRLRSACLAMDRFVRQCFPRACPNRR